MDGFEGYTGQPLPYVWDVGELASYGPEEGITSWALTGITGRPNSRYKQIGYMLSKASQHIFYVISQAPLRKR
jgi:hypothetical protein